jgi:hypothetical protein
MDLFNLIISILDKNQVEIDNFNKGVLESDFQDVSKQICESIKYRKKEMEKRKRPCQVDTKKWVPSDESPNGIGHHEKSIFKGLFHEWGQEAVETNEQGFGNFTVGIVEDESGQVHTVNPNDIKFLDN